MADSNADFKTADDPGQFYKIAAAAKYPDLKSRLNFSVEMPIEYLHFNFGGETRVFTLNQMSLLGYCDILADSDKIFKDAVIQAAKYVLVIDMERFCHDVFGSSN